MSRCIFCEFIENKVIHKKVYDNENVYAYLDWNPMAPVHIVAFPKLHIGTEKENTEDFQRARQNLVEAIPQIAEAWKVADGYSVITEENGEEHIDQNREHLHFHILAQPSTDTPKGHYD